MSLRFEWDHGKALSNLKKHGVSFKEAATVFGDPRSKTIYDDRHSTEEDRYVTVGLSGRRALLVVSHTDRGEKVRIISARRANPTERRGYEKKG